MWIDFTVKTGIETDWKETPEPQDANRLSLTGTEESLQSLNKALLKLRLHTVGKSILTNKNKTVEM